MVFRSPQTFLRRLILTLLLIQINYVLAGMAKDLSILPGLSDPSTDLNRLSQKTPLIPEPDTLPVPPLYNCAGKHWVIISDSLTPDTDTDNIAIQLRSQPKGKDNSDETGQFYPLTRGLNRINTPDGLVYIQLLSRSKPLSADNGDGHPELPTFSEKETEGNPFPDSFYPYHQTGNHSRQNNCHPELLRNGHRYTPYMAEANLTPYLDDFLWFFYDADGHPYLHLDDDHRSGQLYKALVIIKGYCPALFVTNEDGSSLTLLCDDLPEAAGITREIHDNYQSVIFSYNAAGVLMVTIRTPDGMTETMTAEEYRDRKSIWFQGLIEKMTTGGIDHTRHPGSVSNPVLPIRIPLRQPETKSKTIELNGGNTPSSSPGTKPAQHVQQQPQYPKTVAGNSHTGHASVPKAVKPLPTSNHLKIEIKGKETKQDKGAYTQEIPKAVSALLNSGGGMLTIHYPVITKNSRDYWERIIDQILRRSFGQYILFNNVNICKSDVENTCCYRICSFPELCCVSFNCCVTINREVLIIDEDRLLRQLLEPQTDKPIKLTSPPSGLRPVLGEHIGFPESKETSFKLLSNEKTKRVTLVDRMTNRSNKLIFYVSGMANNTGGAIYFGVDDNGYVQGQKVEKGDIDKISTRVNRTIKKLFHPHYQLTQGLHWNIEFREVSARVNGSLETVPDTYVIIITVAALGGGVFLDEYGPEAYRMQNGRVERMPWAEWLRRIKLPDKNDRPSGTHDQNQRSVTVPDKSSKAQESQKRSHSGNSDDDDDVLPPGKAAKES